MTTFRTASLALSLILAAATASFAQMNFSANLTHSQETMQGVFMTSGGQPRPMSFGNANFVLSADMSQLTMTVTFFNMDINGMQTPGDTNDNLGAAHIHANATVVVGMNAPVVWGFFGMPDNDNAPDQLVVTPFANGVGGTISSIWDMSEGQNTTLTAHLNNIMTGHAYINLHTGQFGAGEIRGALVPEPSTTALLGAGILAAAGAAWRRRGRNTKR